MRSDSVKNMSAYADQNHATSLATARLESAEYYNTENSGFEQKEEVFDFLRC